MHPIPRDRLDYLDGLRGWAALSVVIFHCTWELFGSFLPLVRTSYASLLNDGNLAVYIFFVLSGLVLSHGFLVTSDVARLQRLAIGRYLRLAIPIAAASLICLLLLEYGLMFNTDAVKVVGRPDWLGMPYQMAPSVLSWARFFSFDVFFHYDFYSSYDSVLWTMPIELTGSYIVFGLLALSGARRRARLIYCAASLTILWLVNPIMCTFVYGVLIAQLMRSRTYRRLSSGMTGNLLGLACFAAACVGSVFNRGDLGNTTPGYLATGAVLGPVLSPALRRLFESAVSRWLGRVSFPLYLLHSFVIYSLSSAAILWFHHHGYSRLSTVICIAPGTVIASLLAARVFYPVERLAITISHRFAHVALFDHPSLVTGSPAGECDVSP